MRLLNIVCFLLVLCASTMVQAQSRIYSEEECATQSSCSVFSDTFGDIAETSFGEDNAEDCTEKADVEDENDILSLLSDKVLVEIRDNLRLLVKMELPEEISVDGLFSVSLTDPDAVSNHISWLREDKKKLEGALVKLTERQKNPGVEIPNVPTLQIETQILTEPIQPQEPSAPAKPAKERPRGKKNKRRTADWLENWGQWETFDQKMAAYERARVVHDKALLEFEKKQEAYREAVTKRAAALKQYNMDVEARDKAVALLARRIRSQILETTIRIEIASYRLNYLDGLLKLLQRLPDPALTTFAGLSSQRVSMRQSVLSLQKVDGALKRLLVRIKVFDDRVKAGSLIANRKQRDDLIQSIQVILEALDRRRDVLVQVINKVLKSAEEIENRSLKIRRMILVQPVNPNAVEAIDRAFLLHLAKMRHGAQSKKFTIYENKSAPGMVQLQTDIEHILSSPGSVGSINGGKKTLDELKRLVDNMDSTLDSLTVDLARYQQAFRRETVTVLTALASQDTRLKAYSLSGELVADLISDIENLKIGFFKWIDIRQLHFTALPNKLTTPSGWLLLIRWVSAVGLLLMMGIIGRRFGKLIRKVIRRISAMGFFRHRVSAFMRLVGLAESILPTIIIAAVFYVALWLLDFKQPETRFLEVAVRWLFIYALGLHFIKGLTRRISRGRPVFINISSDNAMLLSKTYRRLGLLTALAAVVHEWVYVWLGASLLSMLVLWIVWIWVAIWGIWAFFSWRMPLANALLERQSSPAVLKRLATWMAASRLGVLLTASVFIWLFVSILFEKLKVLLSEGGLWAYLRARSLRRLARTGKQDNSAVPPLELPQRYVKEFPLYPIYDEEESVIVPRKKIVDQVLEQLEKWRSTGQNSSLVLIGEKGIGKTTFLTLIQKELASLSVVRHSLSKKMRNEQELAKELGDVLNIKNVSHSDTLASKLLTGEKRVVLLDEAHNVFLRTVDGYGAYEALIKLVNFTSDHIFWVLAINSFSWTFLNESRQRVHYFRKLLRLPTWSRDELVDLISKRNKRSGVEIEFDEMLLDEARSVTGNFEVIDGAEGFFRLLWEESLGNPRVATRLWLEALTPVGPNRVRVGLFSETSTSELTKMDHELLFTLAAVCQHENLSVEELSDVNNVTRDFAAFAMRFLSEYKLIEPKHNDAKRLTLAPRLYPQVLKVLRQNHLLFEEV